MSRIVMRRARRALLLGVLALPCLSEGRAWAAAQLFDLADRSTVVVWGAVEGVATYREGRFQVFTVRPVRVMKGDATPDRTLALVQERLFDGLAAYFSEGAETLVFAVPLPRYTLYREALPAGSYLQWTERLDTADDLVSLRDPALIEAVTTYLRLRDDPEAVARYLAALATSPVPRLREGALAAIETRAELAPLVDATALAAMPAFLADERAPLTSRGDTLVRLARARVEAIGPIAETIAAGGGPLLPAAVDALVTLDRPPPRERLIAYSESDDEALRLAAARGLVKDGSPEALERIAAIVAEDPSEDVVVETLRGLGSVHDERAVAVLAGALRAGGKRKAPAAADALGREGSPAAIAAMEAAFLEGDYVIKMAAAFGLKQSGTIEAMRFLVHQKEHNPDPEAQRICQLALGESLHQH